MKREEILNILETLSHSQGFYSVIMRGYYRATEEQRDEFLSGLEEHNFGGPVDLVMYLEC